MQGRRALVVDDSKSARVVLSRMLEKFGIEVDSADSAESALEYLRDHHPEVIFMDHMMPGMDGLQAVREIKANPALATIPVMMYTSQEGELYAGEARASGAVGVLPKSIRPIDVTKALYQLGLLRERRDEEPSALQPVGSGAGLPAGEPASLALSGSADARLRRLIEAMLREQSIELRRFIIASLDSQVHRVVTELRPKEPAEPGGNAELEPVVESPAARPWGWILATVSTLVALVVVSVLYWQSGTATEQAQRAFEAVTASNAALTKAIEKWRVVSERQPATDELQEQRALVLSVPFGEPPLGPVRLEALRTLVAQLERAAIGGIVRAEVYSGSFCLSGNGEQGYTLAPAATAASQCEQMGNPYDDTQGGAARPPIGFANLAATIRRRTDGAIDLELAPGPRDRLAVSYPPIDQATSGQWNAAAQSNNRIEISVIPR
ncbi:MAG: response regulator [Gammaproteobacteria bacterium]|nr:response regulator [Gammaproteobacteria bacterium]